TDEDVTVTNAIVPNSAEFTPNAAGPYSYQAVYGGSNANDSPQNLGATSPCEPLTVTALAPKLATTVKDDGGNTVDNANPAALGTAVHDTATLSSGVSTIVGTVTSRVSQT